MRFNDLLHLIATLAPRLDRGDSLGRRMGNLRHPVSSLQPRCRIPVRFPSPQTNFSPYIPLSALPSGMETSWPFLLLFPVTSGLREMRGVLVEPEVRRTVGIDTPRPEKIVVLTGGTDCR